MPENKAEKKTDGPCKTESVFVLMGYLLLSENPSEDSPGTVMQELPGDLPAEISYQAFSAWTSAARAFSAATASSR